jgi:uncharacterized membrane protein
MAKQFAIRVLEFIRSVFLSGFFTVLPFTLTVALFSFSYRLISSWVAPIADWEPASLRCLPGSQIIFVLLLIFLIGLVIKLFFLEPLIHAIESIFFKIPLMKQVYGGIKQLVNAFNIQDALAFKKIVLIRFPTATSYSIGFLTSELPLGVAQTINERYFNVFIPTTPNPTSGFLVQVAEKDIIPLDLTRQEAMSMIISGGIILPDRFKKGAFF